MPCITQLIMKSYKSLMDLDLSWCSLTLDNVISLFECLREIGQQDALAFNDGIVQGTLRSLNLSYNPCTNRGQAQDGEEGQQPGRPKPIEVQLEDSDDEHSANSFKEALIRFIRKGFCKKLTHIDLSGIGAIDRDGVHAILSELSQYTQCCNLLSIHLNDLGFNNDPQLAEDILDYFQIAT